MVSAPPAAIASRNEWPAISEAEMTGYQQGGTSVIRRKGCSLHAQELSGHYPLSDPPCSTIARAQLTHCFSSLASDTPQRTFAIGELRPLP